ncbi:CBS domain-containing protein CBSX3, mitochondrial [Linum grandiflorum]
MQALARRMTSIQEAIMNSGATRHNILPRHGRVTSTSSMADKGLQNMTVADVLMTKGEENVGSWLWCHSTDSAYDAVKNMARNNIGSLVVLKPGQQQHIAGIVTERGHHIRHVPVIDAKIVGMISIVDVVRAVVEQQTGELKRLNDYIQGDYY